MAAPLRVLFLADTHLGFDMPLRPRVERRRRGPDFFRMFQLVMEAAVRDRVDLVVHGGDVFLDSEEGAGTCAVVTLPLRHVPPEVQAVL